MNKKKNYSNEKKGNKKIIVPIVLLICFAFLIFGIVAAYYSDIFSQTGELSTNTLKIEGTYSYFLNGTSTQADSIANLNPGDVIVVKGTITNTGNQSAWVREKIAFSLADENLIPYLNVYTGEFTQADFLASTDLSEYLLTISEEDFAVSGNRVINGSGDNAQTESGGSYNYLNSDTYNFAVTVYFKHSAPNLTQGKTFGFTVETQALQFRNNNAAEPSEAAWATVVAA